MHRILTRWMACLLLSMLATSAHAENLVTIKSGQLPAFPGVPEYLFSATGQPIVVQRGELWRLDESRKEWKLLAWQPRGRVLGSIVSGSHPYLLLETTPGQGIDRLERYPDTTAPPPRTLPPMLVPLKHANGAVLGGIVYLIGRANDGTTHWLSIDPAAPVPAWKAMPSWVDMPAEITSMVAQDAALHLTARQAAGNGDQLWRWTSTDGWRRKGTLQGTVIDGAARAIGQAHLLFFVQVSPTPAQPGGARLITYHTITDAFSVQGDVVNAPVRRGYGLGNGIVWQGADQAPARATFNFSEIEEGKLLLRPLDWAMIVLYLVAIAGIGAYCYWREEKQSTSEFFVGNRTIPFWAAAVSLYVTSTSSIGYIATTAKAFATNWQYLMGNIIGVLGLFFVAIWIVPMLRRLRLVSVFDYLEQRFHPSVRMMASAMCIVLHLGGRMSIILFLPSLAIATITGFDMVWSILIMGVVTIGYTALGGMRAVIWTDFLQLFVKVGGLVFALIFILYKLDGGVGELVATADAAGKLKMLDWSFDITKATVWGFIFVVLMETVLTFPKDQVLMQRVFTTKSDKEAGQSVWLFAAIIIPAAWLFYLIGAGLWVFYQNHPERMNPLLSVDATFPLFIAAELPAGVTGLMIQVFSLRRWQPAPAS